MPKSWPSNEKLSSHFVCIATPSENQIQQIQLKLEKSHFKPHLINHSQRNWNEWKEEQARNKDVIHLIPSLIPDHFQMDQCLFLKGDDLLEKICSPKVSETFYPKTKSNALRFSEIKKGDFIVDKTYGIGLYKGLKILTLHNQKAEYIELEYKDKDRLYVPISQIHRLYPFKTKTGVNILDQLGSPYWNRKMAKASRSIQNLILDLLKMYTARSQINRTPFQPPSQNFIKFEKEFPFEETPDQARSIQEVLKNMTSSHPMERLIIGDSGYGKTEVAMRATFKAVEDGYQVACLAPTTILSLQHFKNFKDRFSKWPVQIDLLNRLVTPSKRKDLLQNISTQKTDIVIGSHRLLSSDIQFKNLGLLIIDEEHRFGVKQKEKFKKMKLNVDCMYLSATPIPRTLSVSLSGAKDISFIHTPPKNRITARIFIMNLKKEKVVTAIQRELDRGGQVIFVHNKIQTLQSIYEKLSHWLPKASIHTAHGQMPEAELESKILKFFKHEYDILLCTTIVESGMDFSQVNTIIINDAHRFGLAGLYQLKGRVGRRANVQPYCYFIVPDHLPFDSPAIHRLNFLQSHNHLGSGYSIARYDLEMRGGGEFLGAKQSGHISNIGYDLYMDMLETSLKPTQPVPLNTEMRLPWSAYIPPSYIPHDKIRLMYYKYLCDLNSIHKLEELEQELRDGFGPLPEEVKNLFGQVMIQHQCKKLQITELKILGDSLYIKSPSFQKKIQLPEKKSWVHVYDYLSNDNKP